MPLVSVLLPAYNAEEYISEAIQSILNQTFTDFELIIINDGSTDNTEKEIRKFTDSRIRYLKNNENIRLIATLNKGIHLAKGKFIARMDADDISLPERLMKQVNFMNKNTDIGLLGTWFRTFNREGDTNKIVNYAVDDARIRIKHLYQIHLCHGTAMFRKSTISKCNLLFDAKYKHAEDYEFWIRLQKITKFANLPFVLYKVRLNPNSVSVKYNGTQIKNTDLVIQKYWKYIGVEISNLDVNLVKSIFYSDFNLSYKQLKRAEEILNELIVANNQTRTIRSDYLQKIIHEKWFHLCYNNSHFNSNIARLYQKSKLKADSYLKNGKMQLKAILA